MNKQEAIKKTEETVLRNISVTYQGKKETWYIDGVETPKSEVVDFISPNKAIIEAPDTSELVFKPKGGGDYFAIGSFCDIIDFINYTQSTTDRHIKLGNCFRIEEDAKNSAKYYIMNSEYDYWFPWSGQPKPKVLPKGLEYWCSARGKWKKSTYIVPCDISIYDIYRWKRSEQG